MVTIYALMSDDLVLYVGQTNRLKRREWDHRNGGSQCSKYVQEHSDWVLKVLEETTDALGPQREQYFYDTLDPLYNQCRPGQTDKDYKKSDTYKSYRKAYGLSDARKASQRAYYLKKKLSKSTPDATT
jgi:hypothetical protein